jgi:hypothetical protein
MSLRALCLSDAGRLRGGHFFFRVCSCDDLRLGWRMHESLGGTAIRLGSEMLSSGNILLSRSGNSFSFFLRKNANVFVGY